MQHLQTETEKDIAYRIQRSHGTCWKCLQDDSIFFSKSSLTLAYLSQRCLYSSWEVGYMSLMSPLSSKMTCVLHVITEWDMTWVWKWRHLSLPKFCLCLFQFPGTGTLPLELLQLARLGLVELLALGQQGGRLHQRLDHLAGGGLLLLDLLLLLVQVFAIFHQLLHQLVHLGGGSGPRRRMWQGDPDRQEAGDHGGFMWSTRRGVGRSKKSRNRLSREKGKT